MDYKNFMNPMTKEFQITGVVLSFLEDISNLKLGSIITDGFYSIAIDGSKHSPN